MSLFDAAEGILNGVMLIGEFFTMRFDRRPVTGRIIWWVTLLSSVMVAGAPLILLAIGYQNYAFLGFACFGILAFIGFVLCAFLSDRT